MPPPPPKVFVSSTWLDLQPERKAVEAAIHRMRKPGFIGMEYFGSRDETTQRASLDEVDGSDVYVGIFAARYGSGITEDEYRRARERKMHCLIYFKAESSITLDKVERDTAQSARLDKLKAELRESHTVSEFTTPEDLATKVAADLYGWFVDEYLPRFASTEETAHARAFAALYQLPAPPRDFTGRAEELDELMREIERGGATISGLRGQGGIGKTTLALKLAEQLTDRYPDAQFYLDLKGTTQPLTPSDAMAHVIRAYHPTANLPEGEAELSALYRSVLHGQRALLLMDNARDAAQVEPLIPHAAGCVLLVTSRWHFVLPGLYAKDLDAMPHDDAHEMLTTIAPRIGEHAGEIARLCGYLPLALRLAASALAERRDLSPADYVRRLSNEQQRLKLLGKVDVSLSVSYDLLTPELQKLWRSLAVFPATFDGAAAAAVWKMEQDAAQDALGELINRSLLDFDETAARYSLHDLARLFADSRLSDAERLDAQARHAAHYLDVLYEVNKFYLQGGDAIMRGLSLFDAEWTNIQAGQSWAASHADDDTAARLCSRYPDAGAYVLNLRLHPREQVRWLEEALSAARKSNDRSSEGNALNNLGLAYADLGETRRAIEFYEQQLTIVREIGDRRGEGIGLWNMSLSLDALGERERAIAQAEDALEIREQIEDPNAAKVREVLAEWRGQTE
jgi:tetratricopeptide (TPR) repeat protein